MDFSFLADPMIAIVVVGTTFALAIKDTVSSLINQKIHKSDIDEIKHHLNTIEHKQDLQHEQDVEQTQQISNIKTTLKNPQTLWTDKIAEQSSQNEIVRH